MHSFKVLINFISLQVHHYVRQEIIEQIKSDPS